MRSTSTRLDNTDGSAEPQHTAAASVDPSGPTRRKVLYGGLAAGLAGVTTVALGDGPASATPVAASSPFRGNSAGRTGIHPFRVAIPKEKLAALRRRVAATTWPSAELVADRSQGVQLATAHALAKFWATKYGWRRFE